MAFDSSPLSAEAARLGEAIAADHEDHPSARIRTLGVLVAVEYEDPESGERRTRTHYRFVEAPEFTNCPTYVAAGLASQVIHDVSA